MKAIIRVAGLFGFIILAFGPDLMGANRYTIWAFVMGAAFGSLLAMSIVNYLRLKYGRNWR